MTTSAPPPYHWTRAKFIAFNGELAATGSVAAAARLVGMSRQSAYRLRDRFGPDYAAKWDRWVSRARVQRRREAVQKRRAFYRQDSVNVST